MKSASIFARALAAFIDYLVVMAAVIPLWGFIADSDWQFLAPFFVGTIYFSVAHSAVLGGQTFGKRLFGLRVRRINGENGCPSLLQAFLRYFLTFGAIILLSELPPLVMRARGVVADPLLLELPMLLVIIYFSTDVTSLVLSFKHLALHDTLAGTIVTRDDDESTAEGDAVLEKLRPKVLRYAAFRYVVGILLGALLWTVSNFHPPMVNEIARIHYPLERDFQVRLVSVGAESLSNTLQIYLLPIAYREDLEELSLGIARELNRQIDFENFAVQSFTFYWIDAVDTAREKLRDQPREIKIERQALAG